MMAWNGQGKLMKVVHPKGWCIPSAGRGISGGACAESEAQRDSGRGEGASMTRWDSRWSGKARVQPGSPRTSGCQAELDTSTHWPL